MVGPVVRQTLFAMLIRFRSFEYALTADIAKMYRQILVDKSQTPIQRIVWRDQTTEDIRPYELLTLTYGTAPASFLATKVIQQLAELEENNFPEGARIARRDFYVDDLLTGANTKEEALMIRDQTTALCLKGGFVLRRWTSSCEDLLKDIPNASTDNAILELDKDGTSKVLGVKWNPRSDVLQYSITIESPAANPCTKRTILANIAQIFDPLGLLGPVIVTAKIMIQRLWRLQIDWDESLPTDLYTEWTSYVFNMRALDGFSVQRKIRTNGSSVRLDLHGFCEATERAYGACIYIRSSSSSHEFLQTQLICSKSRVAPLKIISIPRLELCGAQLLTQLMSQIKGALELNIRRIYYWTDSSIVLSWIKAVDKKLPVFVAHRVGEIQEMRALEDWNHVGTKENPADLVSRGVTPDELKNSQLWWNGPLWLQDENLIQEKVKIPLVDENTMLEVNGSAISSMPAQKDVEPFERFLTFGKLVRVAATCLRFVRLCKREDDQKNHGPLSADELEHARKCLIKRQQQMAFPEEIEDLRQGRPLSAKSSLLQLNPFCDKDHLLRVGGRLHRSDLPQDTKHPVILPHQ